MDSLPAQQHDDVPHGRPNELWLLSLNKVLAALGDRVPRAWQLFGELALQFMPELDRYAAAPRHPSGREHDKGHGTQRWAVAHLLSTRLEAGILFARYAREFARLASRDAR